MKRIIKKAIAGTLIGTAAVFLVAKGHETIFKKDNIIYATEFVNENEFANYNASAYADKKVVYLSNIPYIPEKSSVGWGSIKLDQSYEADNNGLITLIVGGKKKSFIKGIAAHATSTVVYDISELDFDHFSTYYGIDASKGTNGNGVKFSIYTSTDGTNWELHTSAKPPVKKGNNEAEFIDIDIKGKNYIKLYCHNNGNDTADHCVYGDAKLYKDGYESEVMDETPFDFIKTVEEYDNILLKSSYDEVVSAKEHIVLQRKFVDSFGYDILQSVAHLDEESKEAIKWLMTDTDALRYYVTGGKPAGSYMSSLKVLISLYDKYKVDLNDQTRTQYTILGDLYKRMIISLSLTHSTNVCLWIWNNQCSDAATRYETYKSMLAKGILVNKIFETLNIEEMRWVMNNLIDDEEIEWLNHHIRKYGNPYNTNPYQYITYRFGYNYGLEQYYNPSNYDMWDKKYDLSAYNITYKSGNPKLWIVFEQGSVCGGLSKTGSNILGSLGIPSSVIGQPSHAAYLVYSETEDGKGMWSLGNDVSGWTLSEKGERLLAGWGSNDWDSRYNVSYVPYTQEALNDIDNYNKAFETMLLASLYANDPVKLEEIYNKALDYQIINMDAWYGLIMAYKANPSKTAEDYMNLAKRLADNMYYFPLPMYDLLNLIKPKLDGTKYAATFTNYLKASLQKATRLSPDNSSLLQPSIARTMANHLLGNNDFNIATFSFDGDNAGKIMLGSKYAGSDVRWEYSLDGGVTWIATSLSSVKLSEKEIAQINDENDIKIHIVGVNYSEENIFTINITTGAVSANLYGNDLENRVIGVDLTYEWRYSESDAWTSYKVASPDLTGDKTVEVRVGATKTYLPSPSVTFTFKEDNGPDTRKYVPVSHLSVEAVSTEATSNAGHATNAIDGNYNTRYHSAWNGTDKERYITFKLDTPMYISAVEFVPAGGGNGKIYDGTIYGSTDGEDWFVLTSATNLKYTNQANTIQDAIANTKAFEIENPQRVEYVKIVADRTNGNWFTARAFNFYQDTTKSPNPTAGIAYSTNEPTTGNVIARLINPSTDITIINNGGSDTYTFTNNGSFTFEFIDEKGKKGEAIASVDWIDREVPTAVIEYSTTSKTNKEVIAILKPSEEVTVLNNGNYTISEDGTIYDHDGNAHEDFTIDDKGYIHNQDGNIIANINTYSYEFTQNGIFIFEFVDKAGNKGFAIAKVDWIDKTEINAIVDYNIRENTDQNVVVTLTFNKPNVKVLNNDGSNTYVFTKNGSFEFIYQDEAGNVGTKTVLVDWINKKAADVKVRYGFLTKDNTVTAMLSSNLPIKVLNNEGNQTYTFTQNGTFTFIYEDEAGNRGRVVAEVSWIRNTTTLLDEIDKSNITFNRINTPIKVEESFTENSEVVNENNIKEKEYTNLSSHKFTVKVLSKDIAEDITFNAKKLELNKNLAEQFNNNSEYYELSLEDQNGINVKPSESIKLTIELDDNKEFMGIYRITDTDKPEFLNYNSLKGNKIELTLEKLDKYVISYAEDEKVKEVLEVVERESNTYTYYHLMVGSVLVLGVTAFYISKKNDK